ncbi:hypothetical protein SLE2022_033100 [Rubroshorea leprosula]|uniref:Uncharacterized protein n=1 Tax=Rubroshorea leprosula TaxID=152421 RepID=A0AAV5LK28_9ROSI|nr:hypothetical protein SLEP1_g45761 [Rubroshorea leprosula]
MEAPFKMTFFFFILLASCLLIENVSIVDARVATEVVLPLAKSPPFKQKPPPRCSGPDDCNRKCTGNIRVCNGGFCLCIPGNPDCC